MATVREENINSNSHEGDEIGSFLSSSSSSSFSSDAENRSDLFTTFDDSGVHSDLDSSGCRVTLKSECTPEDGGSEVLDRNAENSFFSSPPVSETAKRAEEICSGVEDASLKEEDVVIKDDETQVFRQKQHEDQQQNFPLILNSSYSVPPAVDLAPVLHPDSEITHGQNNNFSYDASGAAVKVKTAGREMANRPVPVLTPSPAIAANSIQRFPEPMLYSTPGFQFIERDTPPPTTPAKHLIQSVIRENQQLKLKFNMFRKEAQAKLKERNESIRKLNEDLNEHRRKVLELKLQKEVLVAQEHNAFQEIQDDIENLYTKLDVFSQKAEEYLHPNNSSTFAESQLQSSEDTEAGNGSVFQKISNLQQRMDNYEKNHIQQIAISRVTTENFQSFMKQTNEKFVKIVEHLVQNGKRKCGSPFDDNDLDLDAAALLQFSPIHIPANSADTEYSSLDDIDNQVSTTPKCVPPASSCEIAVTDQGGEEATPLRELSLNHKNAVRFARNLKRKRSGKTRKNEKVLQILDDKTDGFKDQDHPPPPALSLPSRLAKGNQKRPDTMPKLIPENSQRLNRSDDEPKANPRSFKVAKLTQARVQTRQSPMIEALMDVENVPPQPHSSIQYASESETKMNPVKSVSAMMKNVQHCRDESKPGYTCACGSKFSGAGGLYVHCVKTMEDEKFACNLCDRRYHYFASLKAHRKQTHKLKMTQEVGCSRCGKVFASKSERQGHHDERGLTCWLSGSYQNKEGQKLRNRASHAASTSKA